MYCTHQLKEGMEYSLRRKVRLVVSCLGRVLQMIMMIMSETSVKLHSEEYSSKPLVFFKVKIYCFLQ